jgi:hypothetical protein
MYGQSAQSMLLTVRVIVLSAAKDADETARLKAGKRANMAPATSLFIVMLRLSGEE